MDGRMKLLHPLTKANDFYKNFRQNTGTGWEAFRSHRMFHVRFPMLLSKITRKLVSITSAVIITVIKTVINNNEFVQTNY